MRKPKVVNAETVQLEKRLADLGPAHAYAARIWAGQSPSVPVAERIARIMTALRDQALIDDGEILLDIEAFQKAAA